MGSCALPRLSPGPCTLPRPPPASSSLHSSPWVTFSSPNSEQTLEHGAELAPPKHLGEALGGTQGGLAVAP